MRQMPVQDKAREVGQISENSSEHFAFAWQNSEDTANVSLLLSTRFTEKNP
jgi:hypothetical protein